MNGKTKTVPLHTNKIPEFLMQKYFYILLSLFTLTISWGQTHCRGIVLSSQKTPLTNAAILIKDHNNNILNYGFTNQEGQFELQIEKEGEFTIEVNKIGYDKQIQNLQVTASQQVYKFNFVLSESTEILEDMVIEIDNPIQLRGDTLVYDAKAFSTGREQVVEDLLKNIPGITVEKDGKIKFEDTEIEKIMVDGDDFFNKGYTLLSKNMPNKPLDKVEVLRRYSNNKLLKGVEDSEKVALNLTIQDEYKNLWFGDISLGYGLVTENRYDVTGNLMNFSKKYKNFLTYGLNNVGENRVGPLDDMFYNNHEVESVGHGNALFPLMSLSGGGPGQLKDHRTRINNAEHVSLSTIIPFGEKFKVKLVGFLGFDENYAYTNSFSTTSVGNTYFENIEENRFKSHLKKGYLNFLATYDISKDRMLQFSSVWNQGNTNNQNDLTFNGITTQERLATKNTFFDQKITYTHRWKERNVVLLKTRFFTTKLPQFYTIDNYLMGDLFSFDADAMNNAIQNQKDFLGMEADFKLKQKKGDLIQFQVGFIHHNEEMKTGFSLFNTSQTLFPDNFQTNSTFGLGDLYAKSGYTWKWSTFKIDGRAEIHQLFNRFTTLASDKKQELFYASPSISLNWEVKPTHIFSASYNLRYRNTSFLEVNDTYLLTSSRGFNKGVGAFKLTDMQMVNVGYHIRHYLNRFRFSLNLNYSTQGNIISSRSSIEQNNSLSEAVFIQGGETYAGLFASSFYFRKMKSTVKFDAGYTVATSFNEVNNSGLRKNTYTSQRYNLEWKTNFRNPFNFHIGTDWAVSHVKSPDFTNSFTNGISFLDLYYTFSDNVDIKIINEHYYFGNLTKNQRHHLFMDAEILYKLKGDKYTVGLKANNIFNKQNFTTFYVSDIGYSRNSYRLMSRYLLLSVKYRFSL